MNLTLRIKKVYLDEIANGLKKVEYRRDNEYYANIFSRTYSTLTLHYQSKRRLVVEILNVKKIAIPKKHVNSPFLKGTNKCWGIYLGKVIRNE